MRLAVWINEHAHWIYLVGFVLACVPFVGSIVRALAWRRRLRRSLRTEAERQTDWRPE